MNSTPGGLLTTNIIITVNAPSGGGNIFIDGKKVMSGSGTIKYPIQSGAHSAAFDMTGNMGEPYSIVAAIEQGAQLFTVQGALNQSGHAAGQKQFQI